MELQFALEVLKISPEEAKGLWSPLAAIIHLGAAGITQGKWLMNSIIHLGICSYWPSFMDDTAKREG